MSDTITLAPFASEHLPAALALSRAEAWPHRAEDWALLSSLSRGLVVLADGRVEGTALLTRFGPVGLVNMIIVGEALRGRGLGRRLVEGLMAEADIPEYRLIATEAGLPLYRKLGFLETGSIRQHQGQVTPPPAAPVDWASAADHAALCALDRQATGMDRAPLIATLLRQGRVAVLREAGRPIAWGAIRPFGRGQVAGPLIAPDGATARSLLSALMAGQEGQFMRVDAPEDSGLSPWLETLGLAPVGGGVAMSTAPAPHAAPIRSFALAAQALG